MKKLVDIINIWYSLPALCVIIAPQVERRESLKTKDTLNEKKSKKKTKKNN